jgi:hypothetical protein
LFAAQSHARLALPAGVSICDYAWAVIGARSFSNGNANRKNCRRKIETRWIYKHFGKMKKITSARKSNFLFPFAHAMKFSPDPKM